MNYRGDITLGSTIDIKFTTVNTTGIPTTLAGSPVVSVYVDNNTAEFTTGVTLSVDFDGRTGMHNVNVVATGANTFATGKNYNLVLTAGTVGGNSVVGYIVGGFSIENRSELAIKTVTDKLNTTFETDGSNWRYTKAALFNTPLGASINGNVLLWEVWRWTTSASPTATGQITTNNADWNAATSIKINYSDLAGTNLGTYISNIRVNDVIRIQREIDNTIWGDYTVTATGTDNTTWRDIPVVRKTGSGAVTPINGQNVLVAFFRQPDVDWTDTEKQQIRHRLGIDGTAAAPATGNPSLPDAADITQLNTKLDTIDDFLDTEIAAITAKVNNLPADPASAATINSSFSTVNSKLDVIDDFVDTEVGAVKAVTDKLNTALELDGAVYRYTTNALEQAPTGTGGGGSITAGDITAIAEEILTIDWTTVSGEAAYSTLNALRMLRNVWNTTGGTLSVKKEDGSTNAWTRTLTVDPTAQPITGAS